MPERASPEASAAGAEPASWVEVTVRVDPVDVELVADALREGATGGVVIEPAIRAYDDVDLAYELLEAPAEVRAYYATPFDGARRDALLARLGALPLQGEVDELRYAEVRPADWAEEWKRFFKPLRVGRRIVVRPSWERYHAAPGDVVVVIDPGTGFGTGQHESTRLCLTAIEDRLASPPARRARADVIDVGCGSGILSVAAGLLGARSVRALDVDESAVRATRDNALANGVAANVRAAAGSLGTAWPWHEHQRASADLVVVNISARADLELMPDVAHTLRPGGCAVVSGFVVGAADEIVASAERHGLRALRLDAEGDWRCLVALRLPAGPD